MPILRTAILLLVALLVSGCSSLQKYVRQPEVRFQDLRIVSASLLQSEVAFEFQVNNPNPVGLPVRGLRYQLDIDGQKFLSGTAHEGLEVPARGSGVLRLPVTLEHARIVPGLGALAKQKQIAWALHGEIDFGLVRVPVRATGQFRLPRLPRVSINTLSLRNIDLRGVTLRLSLKVDNPNGFALPLQGLEYRALIGGTPLVDGRSAGGLDLGANASRTLVLDNRVEFRQLGDVWQTLRNNRRVPVRLESQLQVPLPGGRQQNVPLNWEGTVPVR